jgi:hypothetical protein
MLVIVSKAGIHANISDPRPNLASCSVGSSQISSSTMDLVMVKEISDCFLGAVIILTAVHAVTRPNISIPAFARAALAAAVAAATQLSMPSFSKTYMNTSIVDFGNNSS